MNFSSLSRIWSVCDAVVLRCWCLICAVPVLTLSKLVVQSRQESELMAGLFPYEYRFTCLFYIFTEKSRILTKHVNVDNFSFYCNMKQHNRRPYFQRHHC